MAGKTIRIFAKKAFRLQHSGEEVTTRPMDFQSIPEVLTKCQLFKLAKDDGDIQIIATPKNQKNVEKEPGTPSRGNAGGNSNEGSTPSGDGQDENKDKPTNTGT